MRPQPGWRCSVHRLRGWHADDGVGVLSVDRRTDSDLDGSLQILGRRAGSPACAGRALKDRGDSAAPGLVTSGQSPLPDWSNCSIVTSWGMLQRLAAFFQIVTNALAAFGALASSLFSWGLAGMCCASLNARNAGNAAGTPETIWSLIAVRA